MNIKIILEGKIKEPYFKSGVEEFKKRLLNKVEVLEVSDIFEFLKNKSGAYIITLEIEGKMLSSIEFARKLREIETSGEANEILFLIGGAEGLSKEVRDLSDFKFSMSKLTFLHQEATFILIEQIYRAHKILNNEPYHK
ncbi:TPA: 23S rRNA (pseudouridine(1915)-N(3))-methyltransferase RlmH [Candidatus Galligastranaerophilus intestinavium]|uniref:Ribosomal RNA large subunit methyltransferase H n=1 Tax=Candidatus Galligastranaerophilus intestinavium TaxID=2840836 RepID=A0A9D1FGW9_9BACT|nr:23S rRNA (pseudouridine(1915)-N(3))-methyltransferase RlmH [Candidatus Galligastranaerophilus intestinavium]